jgi:thymidylate kinase
MHPEDRIVLVEGLDLAGKTTLCEGLVQKLEAIGLVVVLSKNNLLGQNAVGTRAKKYALGTPVTNLETGALFLASHFYDTTLFKMPLEGMVHLQDSSWLRTVSHHSMHGTPVVPELAEVLFDAHPKFGTVIYLTADIEVRKQRVLEREARCPGTNTPGDYMSHTDPNFVIRHDRRLLGITRRFYPDVCVIDTSSMSGEETIEAGWKLLASKF